MPCEILISYTQDDEALREKFEKHLARLRRQGLLSAWHDRRIGAGDERAGAMDAQLHAASVILLLVSASFLASPYCYDKELQRAMERHQAGEARVLPIILRPCDWRTAPFGRLPALPRDARAITTWDNENAAFTDVARSLRALLLEGRQALDAPRGTSASGHVWTAAELRKLAPAQRDAILQAAAKRAAEDYRCDVALTAFEAFGKDDICGDSSSAEPR